MAASFRRAARSRVLPAALLLAALIAGCPATAPRPPASGRVVVVAERGLAAPRAGRSTARTPAQLLEEGVLPASFGPAAVFELDIACPRPRELRLRLVGAGGSADLLRASSADVAPADRDISGTPGVFYAPDDAGDRATLTVTVLVATDRLSSDTRLELFTRATEDGTPLDGDALPLVRGFYHMATIGDSVAWGNGLPDGDKADAQVARAIEQATGLRAVRQLRAHSAASLVPHGLEILCKANCSGEVPTFSISAATQVSLLDRPEALDLILITGCIVDVSVRELLFTNLSDAEIAARTDQFCREEMTGLLRRVRAAAPQATIVVSGYYPVISTQSDPFGLGDWLTLRAQPTTEDLRAIVDKLAGQATLFRDLSDVALGAAVQALGGESETDPPVVFAPVPFGPENAVFAPDTWLWGGTSRHPLADALGLDLRLFPDDPLAEFRIGECNRPGVVPGLLECVYASIAHPNRTGARVYRDAILDAIGIIRPEPADRE